MPFASISDFHSSWKPTTLWAEYAENPSHRTLGRVLTEAASWREANLGWWFSLPWPLAACLAAAESGAKLGEIAALMTSGSLGTTEDWKAAEQRWVRDGLSQKDFIYSAGSDLPIDGSIGQVGFPFWISTLGMWTSLLALGSDLTNLWTQLPPGSVRTWLSRQILFIAEFETVQSEPPAIQDPDLFFAILADLVESGDYLLISSFNAVHWQTPLSEEQLDLLDRIGRELDLLPARRPPKEAAYAIATGFNALPSREGLLCLIAHSRSSEAMDHIATNSLPRSGENPRILAASVYIRLERSSGATPVSAIVSELLASSDARAAVDAMLNFLHPRRLDAKFLSLLVELFERLPLGMGPARARAMQSIDDILARRRSALATREGWEQLSLPPLPYDFAESVS